MSCECDCEEEEVTQLGLGDDIPEFTLKTFEPTKSDFGEYSLAKTKEAKRWSILFFYPADFTLFERRNLLLWQSSMSGLPAWAPTWLRSARIRNLFT